MAEHVFLARGDLALAELRSANADDNALGRFDAEGIGLRRLDHIAADPVLHRAEGSDLVPLAVRHDDLAVERRDRIAHQTGLALEARFQLADARHGHSRVDDQLLAQRAAVDADLHAVRRVDLHGEGLQRGGQIRRCDAVQLPFAARPFAAQEIDPRALHRDKADLAEAGRAGIHGKDRQIGAALSHVAAVGQRPILHGAVKIALEQGLSVLKLADLAGGRGHGRAPVLRAHRVHQLVHDLLGPRILVGRGVAVEEHADDEAGGEQQQRPEQQEQAPAVLPSLPGFSHWPPPP